MNNVEQIWREYDEFENMINKTLVRPARYTFIHPSMIVILIDTID